MLAFAVLVALVGLAGPRWGQERVVAESRGLNLVIAMDVSRSMLAEDAEPHRMGRALREARRLVQDLQGDRLGLIAFAGSSYILSPLSLDGSAVTLHLDALDPDVASEGGTALAPALAQGGELLRARTELADRVLVVFTDGEAHDSLAGALAQARRLAGAGIHLILVAQGRRDPTRIPLRDAAGVVQGYQQDGDGHVVETRRRDDVLDALAEAGQGTIVSAELPDQAGAVRDLVSSYKRSRSSETRTQQGRPRAWLAVLVAAGLLLTQAALRRTAALIALALTIGVAGAGDAGAANAQQPVYPRHPGEKAWDEGDPRAAARAYLHSLRHDPRDALRYNAGTAALAAGDAVAARAELEQAASSSDPEIRFRSLYNLGLLTLRLAAADSTHRAAHLTTAERAYREALRLKPSHWAAKWNLELAQREQAAGGGASPQNAGGGGAAGGSPNAGGGSGQPQNDAAGGGGFSVGQAEEILRSIGQEELRTRRDRAGRGRRGTPPGTKDW
jgi:Ca-activated chloride channel family protein